ncbi:HAD-IIA family hydrolase [Agrococcus sp. SGAir0287]|uniref:HAD-IIA family hydrolase n=1 Tax=Agrococcus sp. SGAir0287 TaxID=2070347 RepID=UPI0010CCB792|nr:HAD-IIA family hydrolase [Agrococcus sp. SGAir0287]QCR19584.1 haloacid dehalogenase [Agrococcus sp. SGAir0287]
MTRLLDGVDAVLFDLDGVVYEGPTAVPHAIDAIGAIQQPVLYLTNNASRTDAQVAAHLSELGIATAPEQVVTSPQAAMPLLAEHAKPGDAILVVGGDGITVELEARGYRVVRTAAEDPVAVIQGFAPHVGWKDLAEAAFALHRGIPWIATNMDWTIPQAGGIAPGNGTLVSAVHTAVGRMPQVAGKPETPIFHAALERVGARSAIMVGDRLDTDIRGANRAGIPSVLVLTGIDRARAVLAAAPDDRPTHVVADLRELHKELPETRETFERSTGATYAEVGRAAVRRLGGDVTLVRAGEGADTLRAALHLVATADRGPAAMRIDPALLG